MLVSLTPLGLTAEVRSIEKHHTPLPEAFAGDLIGVCLKNIPVSELRRGMMISDSDNLPALETLTFIAQIIITNHPGKIHAGYTPILHCHTAHVPCRINALLSKVDRRSGSVTEEEEPLFLKNGDRALVELVPCKPLCIETFKDFPSLGRFAMRDSNWTVAVGVVKSVTKRLSW
jgi:elongation factor 1-alpha